MDGDKTLNFFYSILKSQETKKPDINGRFKSRSLSDLCRIKDPQSDLCKPSVGSL